jgi:hypothetical protein
MHGVARGVFFGGLEGGEQGKMLQALHGRGEAFGRLEGWSRARLQGLQGRLKARGAERQTVDVELSARRLGLGRGFEQGLGVRLGLRRLGRWLHRFAHLVDETRLVHRHPVDGGAEKKIACQGPVFELGQQATEEHVVGGQGYRLGQRPVQLAPGIGARL